MKAISLRTADVDWRPALDIYGEGSVRDDKALVQIKMLSDRRAEGGGMACMIKFSPPAGKLIKSVSVARSDEHVYLLEGGYCNRAGEQLRFPGHYGLNPAGHPHSAFIGRETVILAVYSGDPDDAREFEVIDPLANGPEA
jgi:hypothetical protein